MIIIFSRVTYREALGLASLETLFERRQDQTVKMFQDISNNPDHKLYRFLPEPNKCIFNLRNSRRYHVPICKTNRLIKEQLFFTADDFIRYFHVYILA